jgi:hypothetical protein
MAGEGSPEIIACGDERAVGRLDRDPLSGTKVMRQPGLP